MTERAEKILIVGAGVGGLALAIGLSNAGFAVDIIERDTKITATGVGMILQGNTLRALDRLGLLDKVVERGFPYSRSVDLSPDGEVIDDRPILRLLGTDRPGTVGIPRRVLADLYAQLAEQSGVTVLLGQTVTSYEESADGLHVTFGDGRCERYDVMVGADGIYSQVREMAAITDKVPEYTGQGVWRFLTRRHPKVTCGVRVRGPSIPVGMIPLTQDKMYVFSVENAPEPRRYAREDYPQLMRQSLAGYGSFVDEVAAGIGSPDEIDYRPLYAFLMDKPWHKGRVVLIGDAVHAMTPHMASGAGMAIEDAQVLTEELSRDIPLSDRLEAFYRRRHERCALIVNASIQIGAWQVQRKELDFSQEAFMAEARQALAEPI